MAKNGSTLDVEVLAKKANEIQKGIIDDTVQEAFAGRLDPDRKPTEVESVYRLHCCGLNMLNPDQPLTSEEFEDLFNNADKFLRSRWIRMCEEEKYEKVVQEMEMECWTTSLETLALWFTICVTHQEGPYATGFPFPKSFRVPKKPLKACRHLMTSFQLAQSTYHYEGQNPANLHSEVFRQLVSILVNDLSAEERTSEVFQECRKLMHEVSKGVKKGTEPDPLECKAMAMLFRAIEAGIKQSKFLHCTRATGLGRLSGKLLGLTL